MTGNIVRFKFQLSFLARFQVYICRPSQLGSFLFVADEADYTDDNGEEYMNGEEYSDEDMECACGGDYSRTQDAVDHGLDHDHGHNHSHPHPHVHQRELSPSAHLASPPPTPTLSMTTTLSPSYRCDG